MRDSSSMKLAEGEGAEIKPKDALGNLIGNESVFPSWIIVMVTLSR